MHPLFTRLRAGLERVYEPREAHAVALRVLDDCFGVPSIDVYAGKVRQFSAEETQRLDAILSRLLDGEPLQYVAGTAPFDGLTLEVRPGVLIPRPETEELVAWAAAELPAGVRVLDAGTGSGCVAVALAVRLPQADVEAWDVSEEALAVARANARRLGVEVRFVWRDMLRPDDGPRRFEAIVSNPPYVRRSERAAMAPQVVLHEPELALFVPDDDALRFYDALARLGRRALVPGGRLYLEINEALGPDTVAMLRREGYADVVLRQDLFGRDRMVRATLPAHP